MNVTLDPHALTPYYYSVVDFGSSECVEEPAVNYTEYNLFCLRSRLQPYINEYLSPVYGIQFVPVQRGSRVVIGVLINDAGDRVELTKKEISALQKKVKEITTISPDDCIIYTPSNLWELSILHYLPLDPLLGAYTSEGSLYCTLRDYPEYTEKAEIVYTEILDTLKDYYSRGAIVCNAVFADKWQLDPFIILGFSVIADQEDLYEDKDLTYSTNRIGIYIPSWQDSRFASNRNTFLMGRMANLEAIPLRLKTNEKREEYLKQMGIKYLTENEMIILLNEIENLVEIREIVEYLESDKI